MKEISATETTVGFVKGLVLALALITSLIICAVASADPTVDLLTDADIQIDGAGFTHNAGYSVADVGDANGDGIDDVIIGAHWASTPGRDHSGLVYVVFGGPSLASFNLNDLGSGGFRIIGASAELFTGRTVAGAGDVDGDGLNDVIVGVSEADYNGRRNSGSSYVIYGKSDDSADVDLADFDGSSDSQGFRIDGAAQDVYSGTSVDGAGDVNGDRFDDLIIGAPLAHHNRDDGPGSAYVVYGGDRVPATIDLSDIDGGDNTPGFKLNGVNDGYRTGVSVSGIGDMNGNGYEDVLVGAPGAGYNGRTDSGSAYVFFGAGQTPATIELASLDNRGFRIDGATGINCPNPPWCTGNRTGAAVSGADDVNNDNRPDVVIGAAEADNNGRDGSGSAYVVFGRTGNYDPVDLADFGSPGNTAGFRIDGAENLLDCSDPYCYGGIAGHAVSGTGDVNGDSYSDVIIGAPFIGTNERPFAGSAYVVYGKGDNYSTVDLNNIEAPGNSDGFRIFGAAGCDSMPTCVGDRAGSSVSGAGDVNDDGCPDALVGAPYSDNNDLFNSGSAYTVYGGGRRCTTPEVVQDPACSESGNRFGIFNFDINTPDSNRAWAISRVTSTFLACGTEITGASSDSYAKNGSGSQFVRFQIKAPPGVRTNRLGAWADDYNAGTLSIDVLTWSGNPSTPIFRSATLSLKVDTDFSMRPDCPANFVACYRGVVRYGDVSGPIWLWVTRDRTGRETLTIGELHNNSGSPVGITNVRGLNLCARAGRPGSNRCGGSSDPWLQRNGHASYPIWSNRRTCFGLWGWAGRGIFSVTATNRDGETTNPVKRCVVWDPVIK